VRFSKKGYCWKRLQEGTKITKGLLTFRRVILNCLLKALPSPVTVADECIIAKMNTAGSTLERIDLFSGKYGHKP